MTYLTAAEYPAIRAAIDVSLDAASLPDTVIALPTFAPEAERWILATSPEAASYVVDSDPWLKAQVAAILACAALLAPSIPNLTSESYGSAFRYTRQEIDVVALTASLWSRARAALAEAAGTGAADGNGRVPARFVFGRVPGRRVR